MFSMLFFVVIGLIVLVGFIVTFIRKKSKHMPPVDGPAANDVKMSDDSSRPLR